MLEAALAAAIATSNGSLLQVMARRNGQARSNFDWPLRVALVAAAGFLCGWILLSLSDPLGIEDAGGLVTGVILHGPAFPIAAVAGFGLLTRRDRSRLFTDASLILIGISALLAGLDHEVDAVRTDGRLLAVRAVVAFVQHRYFKPAVTASRPNDAAVQSSRVLISKYRTGTQSEFHRLYLAEGLGLARLAYSITGDNLLANDCVQRALLAAFNRWKSWHEKLPPEYWLQREVVTRALKYRRRISTETPVESVQRMRSLPAKQLAATALRLNYGYDHWKIACILGIREGMASSMVQSALEKLQA